MKKGIYITVFLLIIILFFIIVFDGNNYEKKIYLPTSDNFIENKNLYNEIIEFLEKNGAISVYFNVDNNLIGLKKGESQYLFCEGNNTDMKNKLNFLKIENYEISEINCVEINNLVSFLNIDDIIIEKELENFKQIINTNTEYLIKIYYEDFENNRNKWDMYIFNKEGWNISNNNEKIMLDNSNTIIFLDNNWILDNVIIENIE